LDILEHMLSALQSEETVMLATIIATSGSTPASAFSKMLVKDQCTNSIGTVGGGCVEGDVVHEARRLYGLHSAAILKFHLTEDHIESGMLCGGTLDVMIEPITGKEIPLFTVMKSLRDEGEDSIVVTKLGVDGKVRGKELLRAGAEGLIESVAHPGQRDPLALNQPAELNEIIQKVAARHEMQRVQLPDGELILEPVAGRPALVIMGGGHVSKYVSRAATMAGFRVTIVDDRKEFANPERFPEAAETICVEFANAFQYLTVKPSTFIVIVTRGHRSDEEILEHAVTTPARYIGMIGSRRKVLTTFERLVEHGVSPEALGRVHAPIGLDIGAVTAEEIGISIVAELVYARRGGNRPLQSKSGGMSSLLAGLPKQ
jgi:xanthine dehydrogenase accessory factor